MFPPCERHQTYISWYILQQCSSLTSLTSPSQEMSLSANSMIIQMPDSIPGFIIMHVIYLPGHIIIYQVRLFINLWLPEIGLVQVLTLSGNV